MNDVIDFDQEVEKLKGGIERLTETQRVLGELIEITTRQRVEIAELTAKNETMASADVLERAMNAALNDDSINQLAKQLLASKPSSSQLASIVAHAPKQADAAFSLLKSTDQLDTLDSSEWHRIFLGLEQLETRNRNEVQRIVSSFVEGVVEDQLQEMGPMKLAHLMVRE